MKSLRKAVKHFISDESGATAIEYGLLAALISVVIITAVALIGTNLNTIFNRIASCLTDPGGSICKTGAAAPT